MRNETQKIRQFLKRNQGKSFSNLQIYDESQGKYVKENMLVNRFLIRHLKTNVATTMDTSTIGKYVYDHCKDLLSSHDFWTTKKRRVAFWYSWKTRA